MLNKWFLHRINKIESCDSWEELVIFCLEIGVVPVLVFYKKCHNTGIQLDLEQKV